MAQAGNLRQVLLVCFGIFFGGGGKVVEATPNLSRFLVFQNFGLPPVLCFEAVFGREIY